MLDIVRRTPSEEAQLGLVGTGWATRAANQWLKNSGYPQIPVVEAPVSASKEVAPCSTQEFIHELDQMGAKWATDADFEA